LFDVAAQIRKLRRELEAAHEKVSTLTTQLNTNVGSLFLSILSRGTGHLSV